MIRLVQKAPFSDNGLTSDLTESNNRIKTTEHQKGQHAMVLFPAIQHLMWSDVIMMLITCWYVICFDLPRPMLLSERLHDQPAHPNPVLFQALVVNLGLIQTLNLSHSLISGNKKVMSAQKKFNPQGWPIIDNQMKINQDIYVWQIPIWKKKKHCDVFTSNH